MFTEEERKLVLPMKLGDRVLVFIFSSILTVFFALIQENLEKKVENGWIGKAINGLAVEALITFSIFRTLALIWALFTPCWLESVVSWMLQKVFLTIAMVLIATALTIFFFTL